MVYPHLSLDSSFESEDDQEQVGHRNKVKRRHSFFFEIHFSSLLVFLTWPEPIYMIVGYVFDLRFSE